MTLKLQQLTAIQLLLDFHLSITFFTGHDLQISSILIQPQQALSSMSLLSKPLLTNKSLLSNSQPQDKARN